MAETPILTGEFVKVIDNSGKIRIPRTITEAVQMPDGKSLQDYIDSLEERLAADNEVDLESILEIIEKLEDMEQSKLDVESEQHLVLEVTPDNLVNLKIGDEVIKTFIFADNINDYVDTFVSENLITDEKNVIGAINELDTRMDETIICDDSVIYDPSAALFARIRTLEELAKSFVISSESDEVPALELEQFYEELNKDTFGLSQEERIVRLENLFNFYITWELD